MKQELRERLLVTLGFLRGMKGKPIGTGMFGSLERMEVPNNIIEPLEDLLFPAPIIGAAKEPVGEGDLQGRGK